MKKEKQQPTQEKHFISIHPRLYYMFLEDDMMELYLSRANDMMLEAVEDEDYENAATYRSIINYNRTVVIHNTKWNAEDTKLAELENFNK